MQLTLQAESPMYRLLDVFRSAEACLRVLLGEQPPHCPKGSSLTNSGKVGIMNAMQVRMIRLPHLPL